jgi:hypothetical protein
MGGVEGLVDVGGAGARKFGNHFTVDRRGIGEVLPLTGATNSPPMKLP